MKDERRKPNTGSGGEGIVERELKPISGMGMLFLLILGVLASIALVAAGFAVFEGGLTIIAVIVGIVLFVVFLVLMAGLKIVRPNEALVLTLFGKYHGTIKKEGFFYVNPFTTAFNPAAKSWADEIAEELDKGKKKDKTGKHTSTGKGVSLKTITLNNAQQKVNDVNGNPIIIGAVVIWKVVNPTKAVFNVENYEEYLSIQSDSIIRNTARAYPYDDFESDDVELTLRGSSLEIADKMKKDLQDKVENAGLEIMEVRITHLAYAEEIAAAMLRRQQATATIAAKEKIVEGAVGMVKMALEQLEEDQLVILDDERKAAMVSNLLVVLCGDKDPQPIVNSGSIY